MIIKFLKNADKENKNMKPRTLIINQKKVIEAIFRMHDETPPNGRYQINVPLGIHKPGGTRKYAPEFLQSGSYFDTAANVCEIDVMQLIEEPDGFYCDSIRDLMDFSDAWTGGREEAVRRGLLNIDGDELPTKKAQKIIDEYVDNAVTYAREALGAMCIKSLSVDGEKFIIKWT